jgi:DNA polymerase-1
LDKIKRTFVDKFLESETLVKGRAHTSFKQHGTETGRLSSENPNLQQVPARSNIGKQFRRAFIPTPGYSFVVADYDQIELRCIAYLSGDRDMKSLFIENKDIHAEAASTMLGVDPESITEDQRAIGKTVNFLVGYGGGAKRLSAATGQPVDDCERFIKRYYERFRGLETWKAKIVEEAFAVGHREDPLRHPPYAVIPPFARRRRVRSLFSDDTYEVFSAHRQLVNAVVQGFAANIVKMAMIDVHERFLGRDTYILLSIHDELVLETKGDCDSDSVRETYLEVVETMESVSLNGKPILGDVPLRAAGGFGVDWVESKQK